MRFVNSGHKIYIVVGPFEAQYGKITRSLALFWRPRWKRLLVIGQ